MSARTVIEHALRVYYADSAEPNAIARDLLAAHRDEVLRSMAAEVKTLGDARGWSVWAAHYMHPDVEFVDTGAPGVEEKATASAAKATPEPDPARERRLEQLLDAIRTWRGRWTTVRAQDLYRLTGGPTMRHVARRDLAELHRRGHLRKHSADAGQHYTLATRKDGRS
ncbi:hypothetical protein [Streptomyces silaceus]|uniref:hypothetical protein n=1 Tax=Streptomyces silaceus TaxID=545123 RepID=UPI0006EB70D9|nr:hypothetical protein [Streptomyces silaceus]